MNEFVIAGSIFAGVFVVGCYISKAVSKTETPMKPLTPREQEFNRLLAERQDILDKLSQLHSYSYSDRTPYFNLYTTRLATLNQMIDNFDHRETTGKCNLCLREDQTILSTEDDNGVHSVCVKCIHDTLLEISAKKHWDNDRSIQN